ncbi:MAG TPA: DUF4388 domain-containing protein, partial [Polyangia bacterium]
MASTQERRASASGSLKERPIVRLLQQLFRKQVTGCLLVVDESGDESAVYLRTGMPVHVHRPVDTDRLDRVLVECGLVTELAVERAAPMVAGGMRLGEALERMGAISKAALADVLKAQMRRKLTRLFCVADGSFAVFLDPHNFGQGDDHAAMRVDPRTLYFPAIRSAYDLPRMTRELSRLWGQQFRLIAVSPPFITAMGIPEDDPVVASLRSGWLSLQEADAVTTRPLDVRSVLLALYYADLLERQNLVQTPGPGAPLPATTSVTLSSDNLIAALPGPAVVEAPPAVLEKSTVVRQFASPPAAVGRAVAP